jgi:signal transduction histidine kinase
VSITAEPASKDERPTGGLAGPIVVLLLVALGGIYALSSLSRATRSLKHTDEVRVAVGRLRATLIDAETGARGYLVTGNRIFLEPYERARRDWPSQIEDLRSLTSDNGAQQARLAELERLFNERMALLERLELPEAPAPGATASSRTMVEGKRKMDAARGVIDEMEVEEVRLDGLRQREAEHRWQGTIALFVATVLVFSVVAGLIWRQRSKAEARRRDAEQARAVVAERARVEAAGRRTAEEAAHFAEMFVGMLGHDLRNPLNAVIMSARLLRKKGTLDPRALERILSSSQRMSNMVSQLLDLTRSRIAGGIPIEQAEVDLAATVAEVVDEHRRTHPDRQLLWEGASGARAWGDHSRLAQVVSNLLGNALEHGDPRRPVTIALVAENGHLELTVHNDGPPIAPELLPIVFDPFRGNTARSNRSQGLGLGLFIAERIVVAHGGRIEVDSTAAAGTTFKVTVPGLAVPRPTLAHPDGHLVA